MAGARRPRWILESPRSAPPGPSLVRRIWGGDGDSFGVGEELAVDGVGDPPLEAAQRFEAGLAGRELAPVVGPAFGVEADLADRGDVNNVSSQRGAIATQLRHGITQPRSPD